MVVQWLGLCFQCRGMGSIPGQETKIPHVAWHGQKRKKVKKIKIKRFLIEVYKGGQKCRETLI